MPWSSTPPNPSSTRPTACADDGAAFISLERLGIRDYALFEAAFPRAHPLAYLRIADAVTNAVARLATDLPGSALVGQDFHLLDDFSGFQVGRSQPPFLPDQDFLVAPSAAPPRSLAPGTDRGRLVGLVERHRPDGHGLVDRAF